MCFSPTHCGVVPFLCRSQLASPSPSPPPPPPTALNAHSMHNTAQHTYTPQHTAHIITQSVYYSAQHAPHCMHAHTTQHAPPSPRADTPQLWKTLNVTGAFGHPPPGRL